MHQVLQVLQCSVTVHRRRKEQQQASIKWQQERTGCNKYTQIHGSCISKRFTLPSSLMRAQAGDISLLVALSA